MVVMAVMAKQLQSLPLLRDDVDGVLGVLGDVEDEAVVGIAQLESVWDVVGLWPHVVVDVVGVVVCLRLKCPAAMQDHRCHRCT